ncbi:ubiquitin-conjugating enzyme/RWD-like protein [Stachybotrys elegans]|uniref:Ubiquitin-conjugating enzyme/RWD-like protein n=1 Tax=Stachybotrys elegans TaxID=80388 RepID=A0A8K0SLC3_9HYPO|nr:ubiquitin-conjugating enzyme/RWD-like protein [Stachybotrys elegans]
MCRFITTFANGLGYTGRHLVHLKEGTYGAPHSAEVDPGQDKLVATSPAPKQLMGIEDNVLSSLMHIGGTDLAESIPESPQRMRRLMHDITMLGTSLPEGIWVRHGLGRIDMMKILIAGPVGTPYEYGLFEFDLFCTASYPTKPPVMEFRTTGNGEVAFNPNLYADGKVCLSLLGTWTGESWGPASTLLQLFVSIQAMILCEQPYYNEPTRKGVSKRRSDEYNEAVRNWTAQFAIAGWLGRPNPSPIWQDVVDYHFKKHAVDIINISEHWWYSEKEEALRLVKAKA